MNPKYSNIFWHQGVKLFEESFIKTDTGRVRIEHLENDVTKALLNVFEHCSPTVLKSFLTLLGIKEPANAFSLEFQVTDNLTYQQKRNRIFLAIVTESTAIKSEPKYNTVMSCPDACIYSENTAILIEAKTQSPLIQEQNDNHIKQYLGTATKTHTITWEQISEKLKLISNHLKETDRFIVSQFCDFLDLIGISEFNGFNKNDFLTLGSFGRFTLEDFIDFKRIFLKKIEKFMNNLNQEVKPIINRNYGQYTIKQQLVSPAAFSAFYFYDDNPNIHINMYPNINFIYRENGIQFTITGEIKSSFNMIRKKILKYPDEFYKISNKLREYRLFLYYKLHFAPMNNFYWNLVAGFPKKMGSFKSDEIGTAINEFEKNWENLKSTIIFQMKSNELKHFSNRNFDDKEIEFAANKNPKPNFAIRIGKDYEPAQIDKLGKKIVPFFKNEISKIYKFVDFVLS